MDATPMVQRRAPSPRKRSTAVLLFAAALATTLPPASASAQSDVQFTPDGTQTLISKQVNGERWSIVADRAQGLVWGNVLRSDGAMAQFVSCIETSRTGGDVHLHCKGTSGCDPWADLGDVVLPESFFHPSGTCSEESTSAGAPSDRSSRKELASALRLTPDEKTLLISKDVAGQRWAIARVPRSQTLAGSVVPAGGGAAQFVSCERSGTERGGDSIYACSAAPGCGCAACSAGDWSPIGDVTLPRGFLEDRRCGDGTTEPDPTATVIAPAGDDVVASFADSVAVSDDTAAISTTFGAQQTPAVQLFQRVQGTWHARARLVSPDPTDFDFGTTVALGGSTLVVGGKRAYVFDRGIEGFHLSAALGPFTDGQTQADVTAVAANGDVVVVAADYPINAALVFERAGGSWRQVAALRRQAGVLAPESLALSGDTLAVGGPSADPCGAVLLYRRQSDGWQPVGEIDAPSCPTINGFGASVALSGTTLLVGADPGRSRGERRHDGAAYVFEESGDTWQQVSVLKECATDLGRFGSSVGLSSGRAVIGAAGYDGGGSAGDVFVFEPGADGWREQGRLVANDAAPTSGDFLAVSGGTAVVGAPQQHTAYAFDLASSVLAPPEPCPAPTPTPSPSVWPLAGWGVEPPEQHGMSSVVLDRARQYAFQPGKHTQAVVVVRHGVIVAEWYEPGRDQSSFAASWSVAKSFAGALIGIAVDQGLIESPDVSMARFIPEWSGTDRESITLRDVLRMESGLSWTEDYSTFQTNQSDIAVLASRESDQLAYVLSKPLARPPGTVFSYSSGDTMLLSRVIEVATGMSASDYARKVLFDPLAMTPVDWWSDVPGHTLTYCCIDSPSRELAKFGLLYARGGLWGSRQVVSAQWVRESTSSPTNAGYGYQWWLDVGLGLRGAGDLFEALGFDGQYIDVIPSLDLVVVRSGHYDKDSGPPIADPNLFAHYPAAGLGTGRGTIPPDDWDRVAFLRPIIESIFE